MSKIVETIEHGGYRSVRVLEIERVNVPDVAKWLGGCPYLNPAATHQAEGIAGTLCSAAASHHTAKPARVNQGWITWEVS